MKRPIELLTGKESPAAVLAAHWCDNQVKNFLEEKWLEWAEERTEIEKLDKLDGLKLTNYYQLHERGFSYGEFLDKVTDCCSAFFFQNGGELTGSKKRLVERMQAESSYMPAREKDNPDTSPEKILLELEDGVAYISKKSGWVLSQF